MKTLCQHLDLLIVGVALGLLLGLAFTANAKDITISTETYAEGVDVKVGWVGEFPIGSYGLPAVLPEVQIGLRSDGVVVWRKKK